MKAVLIRKHGGIEALEIATLPKPKAEAGWSTRWDRE